MNIRELFRNAGNGKLRKTLVCCVPIMAVLALIVATSFNNASELQEDFDGDNMSDAYELFFGLNPTNAADADLDYDNDGLSNLEESKKLTDPYEWDTDRDLFSDLIDSNAVSRAYIRWGDPSFTTGDQYEYAHPDWLLGAYKVGGEWAVDAATTQSCWYVSASESNPCSLNIDLDRSIILTNNLRYAIHYEGRATASGRAVMNSSLFLDLLDTNGNVIAENLFGDLLAASNVESTVILNIPTARFFDAAVIQFRSGHIGAPLADARSEDGSGEIIVYEGLLFIDSDNDGLDADAERQIGTSDYSLDSNNNGTNDYDECFNTGSATNSPDGGSGGGGGNGGDNGDDDDHDGQKSKIIYIDQVIGNDSFTGRASAISANNKGPKKTVRAGLAIAGTNDTMIIKSGNYNENLDISGKNLKVIIEGNVRL